MEKPKEKSKKRKRSKYRRWSTEEIKEILRGYYSRKRDMPEDRWFNRVDLPCVMTVRRRFGPKENWPEAIGVGTPDEERWLLVAEQQASVEPSESWKNDLTENGKTIRDVIDLIGENGKIAQLSELLDAVKEMNIEKQYCLRYGNVDVQVNVTAKMAK